MAVQFPDTYAFVSVPDLRDTLMSSNSESFTLLGPTHGSDGVIFTDFAELFDLASRS